MSNYAERSAVHHYLSELYLLAQYLEEDPNYTKVDALHDLVKIIKGFESDFGGEDHA